MQVISTIKIDRFRSCRNTLLENVSDYAVLCGKNNSGKSNILRALSLFFTGEIEPGLLLNLSNDCNSHAKEKKRISIAVKFSLPTHLNIQSTLKNAISIVPRNAWVRKDYELSTSSATGYDTIYYVNDKLIPIADKYRVDQFLNLFNFRYITANRTPKAVLEENLVELRSELKYRLKKSSSPGDQFSDDATLDSIKQLANKIFSPVNDEIKKADSNITNVSISTPDDLTELLNAAVYQLKTVSGEVLSEKFQGQGIQNLLLFVVLYLVDRNFHRKFGWKIATIWAVEEPETFLHFDLENQLANYFNSISETHKERFQLLVTSHSNVFPQYASSHYFIDKSNTDGKSIWSRAKKYEIHSYLNKLVDTKISTVPNLLTYYPNRRIILVEGFIDEYIISKLMETTKCLNNYLIFSIDKFSNTTHGGDSVLDTFLKANIPMISKRLDGCGIIAIFDWETNVNVSKLEKHFSKPNYIFKFSDKHVNPLLDKSFHGIERYYDTNIIEELAARDNGLVGDRGSKEVKSRYYADTARYELVKHELFNIFKTKGMTFKYFSELQTFFMNIDKKQITCM